MHIFLGFSQCAYTEEAFRPKPLLKGLSSKAGRKITHRFKVFNGTAGPLKVTRLQQLSHALCWVLLQPFPVMATAGLSFNPSEHCRSWRCKHFKKHFNDQFLCVWNFLYASYTVHKDPETCKNYIELCEKKENNMLQMLVILNSEVFFTFKQIKSMCIYDPVVKTT